MSKMGVSTLQGYAGAQLCEAIGLDQALIARHFTGTASRLGGIGLSAIAEEIVRRHHRAFHSNEDLLLEPGGEYHYRARSERHAWNPQAIVALQRATRENAVDRYREFARLVNNDISPVSGERTLRSLLDFVDCDPVPLGEVEAAAAIVRRFVTGAMSFGSLSARHTKPSPSR
jgi:glutamate synthase (NADPH/NADH) large chain